jgi:sortase A
VVQAIPVENESMETHGTNASVSIGSGVQGNIGTVSRSFKH